VDSRRDEILETTRRREKGSNLMTAAYTKIALKIVVMKREK